MARKFDRKLYRKQFKAVPNTSPKLLRQNRDANEEEKAKEKGKVAQEQKKVTDRNMKEETEGADQDAKEQKRSKGKP